ncbi:hypothetical protein [Sphingomonas hankyongi]|uniref:Uncharacterized protein n=1 Tax=Sphingomonas hankyongi TaxID=2908209 RepID=A0ABT0S2S4_9SPHN|nr:hypothetical protein [Sphingomonas hankyongi]MCL6730157.1 hypothetical protein [Sphingomonas hankyongi]
MRALRSSGVVGVLVAGSLFVSSTGAVAATNVSAAQINPWGALTALSGGAPAAALCGAAAAAAAAQAAPGCVLPVNDAAPVATPPPPTPVPVPPVEPIGGGFGINPLLLALGALAAGALIYFLVHDSNNNNDNNVSAA